MKQVIRNLAEAAPALVLLLASPSAPLGAALAAVVVGAAVGFGLAEARVSRRPVQ